MTAARQTEDSILDPARHAPVTYPHTPISAALGVAAAAIMVAVLAGVWVDSDRTLGERLYATGAVGVIVGLSYLATRLQLRKQIRALRDGYHLGRRVERAVSRRRSAD